MSLSIEVVSIAYDLWYDATTVDGDLGVMCWISHGPRADDSAFDPQPGDRVLVGDDEEKPLPASVVSRDGDRVALRVAVASPASGRWFDA